MAIKIFIDQGHNPTGYHNTGASWYGRNEQDITYIIGQELAALLLADGRFEVMLSRPTPETVLGTNNSTSLIERVRMANSWPADYFISIHTNASTNTEASGTEVYVYKLGSQSNWLAAQVLDGIVETVGTKDRAVRVNSSLYVLKKTTTPASLAETAYLSNLHYCLMLELAPGGFAFGIYPGVLRYLRSM